MDQKFIFSDFITAGLQLNLIAAIDFTGSNGDPSIPASLHYESTSLNQYQEALKYVGDILIDYDYD